MIDFDFRPATLGDFDFLFSLKKNAEYEAIKAVFGWDEEVQQRIHHEEWQEDQPTIVTVGGQPAGSFLLQDKASICIFVVSSFWPDTTVKGWEAKYCNTAILY